MDKKDILFTSALIFVFFIVYSPHFMNFYPFHFDEWTHISKTVTLRQEGLTFDWPMPIEIGFDILLLVISLFFDLVLIYQFLPAINAVIIAVILFYFLKKEFGYWAGLSSVIFLASLRSNINVLGLWFFVPVIAAISFDYLCLFFLEGSVKNNKPERMYLVALFLFLIAFIHQSSFLVVALVVFIYLCFNYKFVLDNKKYFTPFLILAIPILLMILFFNHIFGGILSILSYLIWGPVRIAGIDAAQISYSPFLFYGILLSIFAAIGYYFCYNNKKLLTFRIYVIIPLLNIFLFPLTNFTVFSSYQRYVYHFMIAALPLSAAGFYYSVNYARNLLKKYGTTTAKLAFGIMIIFSFTIIFFNYYKMLPEARLIPTINSYELEALQSLRDYPEGNVLAVRRLGAPMKAVSNHEALYDLFNSEEETGLTEFYGGNCSFKEEMLREKYFKQNETGYVHSKKQINCSFLKELYQNENNYIYEIELN